MRKFLILFLLLLFGAVQCVIPSGQLSIRYAYKTVDFSVAHFGGQFAQIGYSSYARLIYPSSDAKGCGEISKPYVSRSMPFVLILERGECSFYSKAKNAQEAGAAAVLIYNSLEGIYSEKPYADSRDYDCSNGEGWVEHSIVKDMTSSDVYGPTMVGSIPDSCSNNRHCNSDVCLYTNATDSDGDQKACCAWDLYMSMGSEAQEPSLTIPVGFLRMQDYRTLNSYKSYSLNIMEVAVYEKAVFWSWSAFVIWLMAVAIVAYGSVLAAEEDQLFIYTRGCEKSGGKEDDFEEESVASAPSIRRVAKSRRRDGRRGGRQGGSVTESTGLLTEIDDVKPEPRSSSSLPFYSWFDFNFSSGSGRDYGVGNDSGSVSSSFVNDLVEEQSIRSGASEFFLRVKGHVVHAAEHMIDSGVEEDGPAVELNPMAAIAFILTSSAFLVTLYYIDIFSYVSIAYLVAAAYAVHVCCFEPMLLQWRRSLYFALFVYDWSRLPRHVQDFVEEVLCLDCFDSLRSSNLPLMQVDGEDAVYDEETGEMLTESNLNHNSRFYLDPHLARDIAERDERSRREGESMRARRSDLPVHASRSADGADDVGSVQSSGQGPRQNIIDDANANMASGTCVPCKAPMSFACGRLFDLLSMVLAVSVAVLWYLFPTWPLRWLLQDVMGASVSIFFLRAVRVSSLKVATALLCCAFVYDIFFVFISPLIFGTSVMMSVASGGSGDDSSPLSTDENYCEKFPSDDDCAVTNVPMLLYAPAFWTWNTNANSMLGLGDVILPGLLLVWTARYDLRLYGSLFCEKAGDGYFPMAMVGYAFGLCLAQLAVEAFDYGQPALLYIVPCVLAPVLYRSHNSGHLLSLWEELPPMKTVGLPLGAEEQDRAAGGNDITSTTAMWPASLTSGNQDHDNDDMSIYSLHGYDLERSKAVRSRDTITLSR
jgi:hypothetical protein